MIWPTVAIGEIACLLRNGMSIKQSPGAGGMPITRIETIAFGSVNLSRCGYAGLERKDCSAWLLEHGDILISHINSLAHLGKCAIFEERGCEVVHGMNLLNMRVDQSVALPRFILHALKSKRFVAQISTIAKKSVNQASFNISTFKELEIPLPPLEEQRRIAVILDKASALKQQSLKALAQVESLGIARLEQLLIKNKESLTRRRLEELCATGAPITYGILQPGPDIDEGIPYVRPSEIKNSQIDIKRLKKTSPEIAVKYHKSELKAGDILLTIVGTIGETALVPPELEGGNITQSSARVRIDPSLACPAYIYHFFKSQHALRQISRDRLGVAVERLNLHHVRDMEILCLPMEIQDKFGAEVHSLAQLVSRHSLLAQHTSSLLNSLSNSLLVSGQEP
jgi:type I restriction enzyme S subunit